MQVLVNLFDRDLSRLKNEIAQFSDEDNLWKTTGSMTNTAGNLCLHLVGNLNHFVGAQIGDTGYIRDRAAEFADRNVPKDVLIKKIEAVQKMTIDVLGAIGEEKFNAIYPQNMFEQNMSHSDFLIHLLTHLNYHLGQINYLRRMLE